MAEADKTYRFARREKQIGHRFTLLACACFYGVLGSPDGRTIVGASMEAVNSLRNYLNQPIRLAAPPESITPVGGYRPVTAPDIPPGDFLWFEYKTEELTGLTVYVCFYGGDWFVREIRGTGGLYHRMEEGGAECKTIRAAEAAAGR